MSENDKDPTNDNGSNTKKYCRPISMKLDTLIADKASSAGQLHSRAHVGTKSKITQDLLCEFASVRSRCISGYAVFNNEHLILISYMCI